MSFLDSILPALGGVAGFALGGPAGAAIGSGIGGAIGASRSQAQGAQNAINTQNNLVGPYVNQGTNAMKGLNSFLGLGADGTLDPNAPGMKQFGPADYMKSPGYDWLKNETLSGALNKRSSLGGVLSGNTLRDLTGYSSGLASQDYQNAFNRYNTNINNIYSRLFGQETLGANAATGNASNIGSLQNQIGTTDAAGILGGTNAAVRGLNNNILNGNLNNNWLLANMQQQGSQIPSGFGGSAMEPWYG